VRLINALVAAGASLQKLDNEKRNVILYACEAGVDPIIFDALLNWNPRRKINLDNWWRSFDQHGNGACDLACESGNFNLAEHVLRAALTHVSASWFLPDGVYNILRVLSSAVLGSDESAAIKILNICHKVTNEVSEGRVLPEEKLSFELKPETYSLRSIQSF
jgi:hypothetical protein